MAYLYGSSVQGIQSFIFATNRLKENVGASELVESVCSDEFYKFFTECGLSAASDVDADPKVLLHAAGNVRFIATDEKALRRFVRAWPKKAAEVAPGVTLSQAVVEYPEGGLLNAFDELEERLRIQRNLPMRPTFLAPLAAVRCRRTGLTAVDRGDEGGAPRDEATRRKQKAGGADAPQRLIKKLRDEGASGGTLRVEQFAFDTDDMTSETVRNWIAVVHADGNALGQILLRLSRALREQESSDAEAAEAYRSFSQQLDAATRTAARKAFEEIVVASSAAKREEGKDAKYPFRPLILGGDDLTVLCCADLAVPFVSRFLEVFEQETRNRFQELARRDGLSFLGQGLTACAGIAFIKKSYPFHYGYRLAEDLCRAAKKRVKSMRSLQDGLASALLFHRAEAAFVEDYDEIVARELTPIPGDASADGASYGFDAGPYVVGTRNSAAFKTVDDLIKLVKTLAEDKAPRAGLREWLGLLFESPDRADLLLQRIREVHDRYVDRLGLRSPWFDRKEGGARKVTMLHDALVLTAMNRVYWKNVQKFTEEDACRSGTDSAADGGSDGRP